MLVFLVLSGILLMVGLYCLMAVLLKLPTFRASGVISRLNRPLQKSQTISNVITVLAGYLSPYIPLGVVRKTKLQRLLSAANINLTPQQYTARQLVGSALLVLPLCLLGLLHPLLLIIPALAAGLAALNSSTELKEKAAERSRGIEKELPQFILNVTAAVRTNRDVIGILTAYRQDRDTPLTRELAVTIADMRTGSPERALEHLELRVSLPLMTELIRALLATMRGEDMSTRYRAIIEDARNKRSTELQTRILKLNPKISSMSMTLAMWQIASLLVICGSILFTSWKF